jgi:polyisoprenoid-binding protein YceI
MKLAAVRAFVPALVRSPFAGAVLACACTLGAASPAEGVMTKFHVDPYHSQAIILVDHFGVSRMGGMFGQLSGTIDVDPTEWTGWNMEVTIPVFEFISTHPPRTDAVKGPNFLDAANHPEIKFACKSAEKKGDAFIAAGTLTIRGITKEVSFPLVVRGPLTDPIGKRRIGFEGELIVSRRDFGMEFDRRLPNGDPTIGNDVTIMLQVEALQEGGLAGQKPE